MDAGSAPHLIPSSLAGQDTWFSPMRPGFESRLGNIFCSRALQRGSLNAAQNFAQRLKWLLPVRMSRLAQLVERKTLNLVVEGSSPSVGNKAPVAQLAARRSHNPKVASSILAGSIVSFPVSLVGQDTWLSPMRPGFNSRTGNYFFKNTGIEIVYKQHLIL